MKNHAVWLAIGATIFIFAIVAWMMLDNACSDLGNAREVSECWRGWVGAWSGWVGAIGAALAAAWVVIETRAQIRQQAAQYFYENLERQIDEYHDQLATLVAARTTLNATALSIQTEYLGEDIATESIQSTIGRALRDSHIPALEIHKRSLPNTYASSLIALVGLMNNFAEICLKGRAEQSVEIGKGIVKLCEDQIKNYDNEIDRLSQLINEKTDMRDNYGVELDRVYKRSRD